MWSEPVTLGGGITTEKGWPPGRAPAPALKAPAASQRAQTRASALAASNVLSMRISSGFGRTG